MNETTKCAMENLCAYEYEYDDGDQIRTNIITFRKDGQAIKKMYMEGYMEGSYKRKKEINVSVSEMIDEINAVKDTITKQTKDNRSGYVILKDLALADLETIDVKVKDEIPAIGAKPSWYVIPHRIKELADAISRNTEHQRINNDKEVTKCIKQWAIEIICHCETLDKLQNLEDDIEQ